MACVDGCVVVPGGVLGGISAGPRGLFSALLLAVAIGTDDCLLVFLLVFFYNRIRL